MVPVGGKGLHALGLLALARDAPGVRYIMEICPSHNVTIYYSIVLKNPQRLWRISTSIDMENHPSHMMWRIIHTN